MTREERAAELGKRLRAKYPKRTGIVAWSIILISPVLLIWLYWDAVANGRRITLVLPLVIAVFVSWRHYRQSKPKDGTIRPIMQSD